MPPRSGAAPRSTAGDQQTYSSDHPQEYDIQDEDLPLLRGFHVRQPGEHDVLGRVERQVQQDRQKDAPPRVLKQNREQPATAVIWAR